MMPRVMWDLYDEVTTLFYQLRRHSEQVRPEVDLDLHWHSVENSKNLLETVPSKFEVTR